MKVTLLAVVALTTVASLVGAADPECVYRRMRNLTTHWPKPSSCSTYYRCSSKNTVRTVTCPAGKEYNPKNGRCSNAGRGLCKLSLVAPLLEATNVCSDEVNGAYLANSDKCGEFFICDEQVAYAQKCDSGSYFNETLAACIPDTDSLCWQNLCINKTDGVFVENENNCGSYYICSDSEATLQTCPSGSFFNTTVAACTVDVGNSECWVNFCIGKSDGSAVADKSDCSTFYVCSNNTATRQECPEGSYFEDNNWGCVPGDCPTEPPCDGSTTTTPAPCDEVTTTTEPCEEVTTTTTEPCEEVTTTEAPASCDCGDVKNGDFVPDESNCRKYSICVDGKLVSGDCGKGNLFNATLSVCEVDDKNQCCVADCTDGVLEVDPQDCTKYLTCTAGDWVSTSCATGSYFNTDLKACQVDEKNVCITPSSTVKTISANQCSAKDLPTSGKNCWSYTVCVDGQWEEGTCSKDYYFDDAVGICREDTRNVCPENRSTGSRKKRSADTCEGGIQQGSIIAHPTDCDKYQICEGGQLVVGLCGVGNLFQNSSGVCYPDYKATCWVCINKPNGYQMPNPTDCTSYLTCWDGVATEHSCGSDEWYDGNNECAVDVAAKCINPCGCGNGNVAHPICTKYFQCTDGVAKVVQCPAGQGFDSETGYCSSNVECSAEDCSTASDGTTYPVAGDPSKFYYCNDQVATIASCPPNSAYDASLGLCQSEPSTSCDQSVCKTAADYSTYPSLNDDSSTFCVCQDGGGYINSCPTGLFYDKDEEACTFTGNCDPRVCDDESEYSVSQDYADPNSFCLCRAGDPVSVPCPRGYTFDSEKLLCVLIPQPDPRCCKNSCVGKSDFDTVSALHTADGFCLCVDEVPKYTNCPANSQYDADLGACTPVEEETICAANECEATLCENQPDYTTYPLGCKTSGFCYCLNNCPVYHPCPGDLVYDTDLGICDTPVDPDYKPKCNDDQCDILGDNTAFAPNDGLDGFCYCDDGLATYHDCPAGEQFNEEFGICQAPDDACVTAECDVAKCAALGNGGTFPTNSATEDSNSFCYCDDDQVHLLQCGPELVYLPTEGICGVKEAPACTCEAGKCTATDDYLAYPALNTENGFCLCVAGTPVYKDCPEGESFDSDVGACLSASKMLSVYGICDSALCHSRAVLATTYPAKNTTNGYCSCQEVGVSSFTSCAAGHVYEQIMGTCVVEACDYTVCLERSAPEAFEARNTTDGFCSCNGVPIFHHCPRGQAYDKVEKLCAIKDAIAMISCSLKECKRRSQFEPFAAENTKSGFCSCDDQDLISVTYHPCPAGEVFDPELGVCSFHSIQKRSLEAEENVRSISLFKRFFPKLF